MNNVDFIDRSSISRGRVRPPSIGGGVTRPDWFHTRKWHLTPWKKVSLMDHYLADDVDESGDDANTSWLDVLNNTVTQAGNVLTSRNTGVVPPNRRVTAVGGGGMRAVPGTPGAPVFLGMTTNQLLLAGAAVVGGLILLKKLKK